MRRTFLAAIAGLALAQIAPPRVEHNLPSRRSQLPTTPRTYRKLPKNPVASLVSVPLQNNSKLWHRSFDRNQNVINISAGSSRLRKPELEHDHSLDRAGHLANPLPARQI